MVKLSRVILLVLVIASLGIQACRNSPGNREAEEAITNGNGTAPEWTKDAVIYELNIRQYSKDGTFAAIEKDLPRLRDMGVDIIWLMPVHPIGELNRKGSMGSYYAVKDYLDVDPGYGSMEDFQRLVNRIHEEGMYVILDWVANHSAWDNTLMESHPHWYTRDSAGNAVPPVADWADVADFNYDQGGLRNYMADCLKFWVAEMDIDGYRCDVADMVPTTFWDSVRVELDKIKPVFMLAEAETPSQHTRAFDMTYAWDMHHIMNGIAQGTKPISALDDRLRYEDSAFAPADYRMLFTSNHDENSWNGTVFERMGDAAQTMAVLSFTLPGMPLIYSGQEAPMRKRLDFFEKDAIDWNNYAWQDFYRSLCTLKSEQRALWNGIHGADLQRLNSTDQERIYAFSRGANEVVCVFNLSKDQVEVNLLDDLSSGSYREYFSQEEFSFHKDQSWTMTPWSYRVFVAL